MKKLLFLSLLATVACSEEVSYEDLKKSAHDSSSRLKIRSLDAEIEKSRLDSLYSTLYPQLSLDYTGERSESFDDEASKSFSVGDTVVNTYTPYKHSVSLRLNYEIFRFGATLKQIEMAKQEVKIRELERCSERSNLDREILDLYIKAQYAAYEREAKEKIRALRNQLFSHKQRLHQAGVESRVAVGEEAILLVDLEHAIKAAQIEYERNIFLLSKLSHKELDPKNTTLTPLESSETQELSRPFAETTQGKIYQEKISQKRAELSVLNRNQLPVVSLYGNYYLYGSDQESFRRGFDEIERNSWSVGLRVRWVLFEGFRYSSDRARILLERSRLEEERRLSEREYTYELLTLEENLKSTARRIQDRQKALEESRLRLAMVQRLRQQGEADSLSLLTGEITDLERELELKREHLDQSRERELLKIRRGESLESCVHPAK